MDPRGKDIFFTILFNLCKSAVQIHKIRVQLNQNVIIQGQSIACCSGRRPRRPAPHITLWYPVETGCRGRQPLQKTATLVLIVRFLNRYIFFQFAICNLPFAICILPFAICHLICAAAYRFPLKKFNSHAVLSKGTNFSSPQNSSP